MCLGGAQACSTTDVCTAVRRPRLGQLHTLYNPLSRQTIESWSGTAARTDFTYTTVSCHVSKPRHGHDAHLRAWLRCRLMRAGGRQWWRSTAPGAAWRWERRRCRCPCQSPSASPPAHTGSTCAGGRGQAAHPGPSDWATSGTHCSRNTCDTHRRSQAFGASGMASDSCQICSKRHSFGTLSCYSAPMLTKQRTRPCERR